MPSHPQHQQPVGQPPHPHVNGHTSHYSNGRYRERESERLEVSYPRVPFVLKEQM
ncbi:hypothetical protein M404DRAFT_1006317 [Pisolithus tinctorius Marx 270]|uniref:Uncharacterized protein n=1 Tax=Pisolithus tinctorius Marx 270 TaxID=870435 RepID=A0A0C3NNZ4_PISTI|nr:hypothetical protein M404DRAFT_1006317 [Pisolithus tinctorius Marx 270]